MMHRLFAIFLALSSVCSFMDWYKDADEVEKTQLPRNFELPSYSLYCDENHRSSKGNNRYEPLDNADPTKCKESWEQLDEPSMRYRAISWLRDTLIQRSSHNESYRAASDVNLYRMKRFMNKIRTGQNVSIFVLGGSLTQGAHVGGIYGAYSKKLENALNDRYNKQGFSNSVVKVTNKAVGGTTTLWALHQISIMLGHERNEPIDLVTIDYDVNDCAKMRSDLSSDQTESVGNTEYLLREVLEHETLPAVLFVNNAITHAHSNRIIGDCGLYHSCYALGELRRPILDAYQIPLVSQKEAIWHNFSCPPPDWRWSCHGFCSHPNANGHQLISTILYGFLTGESFANDPVLLKYYDFPDTAASAGGSKLPHTELKTSSEEAADEARKDLTYPSRPLFAYTRELDELVCTHSYRTYIGLVAHSRKNHLSAGSPSVREQKRERYLSMSEPRRLDEADMTDNMHHTVAELEERIAQRDACWKFKEDVKGKPGWIVDDPGCVGSTITFNVTFGSKPFLNIVFLSTYNEHFGDLVVEMTPNTHTYPHESLFNTSTSIKWDWMGVLEGYDDSEQLYSMSVVYVFQAHPNAAEMSSKYHHTYIKAESMRPNSDYLVRMKLTVPKNRGNKVDESVQPWKFKILSLATC